VTSLDPDGLDVVLMVGLSGGQVREHALSVQMELAYDWPAYVARLHAAAAELAGAKVDAAWDRPPR
jgi:hypothetical protein